MLEYTEPDIILASETWLQPGITEREILPPDFRFFARKDRLKDAHGGVAIIARSDHLPLLATLKIMVSSSQTLEFVTKDNIYSFGHTNHLVW